MNSPSRSKEPVSTISAGSSRKASIASRPSRSSCSRSKPSEATLVTRSSWASSKASSTPGSPKSRAPRTRNSMPNRVLPEPAAPVTRVGRPRGRPPLVISSKPVIPVGAFSGPARSPGPPATGSALVVIAHPSTTAVSPATPALARRREDSAWPSDLGGWCGCRRARTSLAGNRRDRAVPRRAAENRPPTRLLRLPSPCERRKRLVEGPFWAVTLVSHPTAVNGPRRRAVDRGLPTGCG